MPGQTRSGAHSAAPAAAHVVGARWIPPTSAHPSLLSASTGVETRGVRWRGLALGLRAAPVLDLGGAVVGHTLTLTRDIHELPDQPPNARVRLGAPLSDTELHQAYVGLDLAVLCGDRFAFLPATPRMLDGYLPTPAVARRMVLDLPPGFEELADAVPRAQALRGLGAELALRDYRGTGPQEDLLSQIAFVEVAPWALVHGSALVDHVHGAGPRVLAGDVHDEETARLARLAGVDGMRVSLPPVPATTGPSMPVTRSATGLVRA